MSQINAGSKHHQELARTQLERFNKEVEMIKADNVHRYKLYDLRNKDKIESLESDNRRLDSLVKERDLVLQALEGARDDAQQFNESILPVSDGYLIVYLLAAKCMLLLSVHVYVYMYM